VRREFTPREGEIGPTNKLRPTNVTSLKKLNDEQMYDIITLMPHN